MEDSRVITEWSASLAPALHSPQQHDTRAAFLTFYSVPREWPLPIQDDSNTELVKGLDVGRPMMLEYGARLSLQQGLCKEMNLTPSTLNLVSTNNR